jgi:hypothetical protein
MRFGIEVGLRHCRELPFHAADWILPVQPALFAKIAAFFATTVHDFFESELAFARISLEK